MSAPLPPPPSASLYEVLGVDKDAPLEAITKAYRRQSLLFHPDRNPSGAEAFKRVATAYHTLADADKRALYDASGVVDGDDSGGTGAKAKLRPEDVDGLIADFYRAYRGSPDEAADAAESFEKCRGNFAKMVTQHLLFENAPGEVRRLHGVVAGLVASGRVAATEAWATSTEAAALSKLEKRMARERTEAEEALAALPKRKAPGGTAGLQALILGRQAQGREEHEARMAALESKYVGRVAGKKSSRK